MVCIKILLSRWMQSWPPAETFLAVSGKYIKFILFSKSPFSIFPQYVPLDMRNSVITTSLKRFDESPETLRSMYKKVKKIMKFKEMICLKILWSRWMQSWPPRRSFPRSLKEWYKTYTFFEKSFFVFPPYVPMDTKNAVITTSLKSCRQKAENISLKVQKW